MTRPQIHSLRQAFLTATLGIILSGCATAPPPQPTGPQRAYGTETVRTELQTLLKNPYSDTQSIDIIYATNRSNSGDVQECSDQAFGVNPTGKLSYGVCKVNVPKHHSVGGFTLAPNPRSVILAVPNGIRTCYKKLKWESCHEGTNLHK